jgi:CRP-like cAMP-binding protein
VTPDDAVEALRACPLFRDFPDAAIAALAPYFQVVTGERGAHLFEEGHPSDALYVIAAGSMRVAMRDTIGAEHTLNELRAPDTFGELSLILRSERMVTAVATEEVVLLELDGASFRDLKSQNPDLCLLLIMALVRRFGRLLDDARDVLKRITLRQLAGVDAD